jgi:carbonic anhydrase/acetyltransferase-like protein (isoleucine patch superfamily)
MKDSTTYMIRAHRGVLPRIAASAYIDSSAQVIGDVEIGERSSIWPGAVLRGDVHPIRIGEESSIQDNCVVHVDEGEPTTIGNRVTVGHSVVLHGCTVEDDSLIGIGAIVLNGARIGRGSVVGAGSLIPEGTEIPPESLVLGVPGKVRRPVSEEERARFQANCAHYVGYGQAFKEEQP